MIRILPKPPETSESSCKDLVPTTDQPVANGYWSWNLVSKTYSLAMHFIRTSLTWSRSLSQPPAPPTSDPSELKAAASPHSRAPSPPPLESTLTPFDYILLSALNKDQDTLYHLIDESLEKQSMETLASSVNFWLFICIEHAWPKIEKDPEKLNQLIMHTKPEFFLNLVGVCSSLDQAQMILTIAFKDRVKLLRVIEGVISMMGDDRNSAQRENIYKFFLEEIMRREGNDHFIAEQIKKRWDTIQKPQHDALTALKNFPEVQKVIAQKNSTP